MRSARANPLAQGDEKICYGMNCVFEDRAGECQKPFRVPCPMDEDCEWTDDDFLYDKERREGYDVD